MFSQIKKMFLKENSIRSASLILMITFAASNVLGVIRDHFLAQKIPTDRLDIYYAAFRWPDLIFNVLILGSVAAAFVPVYSKCMKEEGEEKANELATTTISVAVVIVAAALVMLFFLMPYLMHVLVPSFSQEKMAETIQAARWLLISPLIFTVSYFLGGVLNARKRFVSYALAPIVYNLSIILSILFLSDRYGVRGVIIGVITGAFLHMLTQLPASLRVGLKIGFKPNFFDKNVIRIIRLMVPRAIGLGANQILLFAYTGFASAFPGAIAIYNLTDNIQTVPSAIFGNSFATAVFPTLAELSIKEKEERERFCNVFVKAIKAALFFLIPATAVIFVLRAQIIRLILGYGFFGWADTKSASAALGFFALSVVAQGLIPIFARGFYAMHDTKTPMTISLFSILASIVFGYIFSRGGFLTSGPVAGLALAFSIGSWINLILLFYYIQETVHLRVRELSWHTAIVSVLTLVAASAMQATKTAVAGVFDINRVRFLLLQAVISLTVGAVVYLSCAWIFKLKEVRN